MKDYLKMADVFIGEYKPKRIIDAWPPSKHGEALVDISGKPAEYAVHAINSHDELVEMNRELLDALNDVASSLSWLAHGECMAFVDGPILTSSEAINKARLAIAKAKGGAV